MTLVSVRTQSNEAVCVESKTLDYESPALTAEPQARKIAASISQNRRSAKGIGYDRQRRLVEPWAAGGQPGATVLFLALSGRFDLARHWLHARSSSGCC